MNRLLPEYDELKPITKETDTFYECGFNKSFDLLDFKSKVQVLVDIVRQSIKHTKYPNPNDDISTLSGDSYTCSNVLINYMKKLNIGHNFQTAFCINAPYENENSISRFTTIFQDDNGVYYQADATPLTGYNYGVVEPLKNNAFNEYILIDENLSELLNIIRELKYLLSINAEIKDFDKKFNLILNCSVKYPCLKPEIKNIYTLRYGISQRLLLQDSHDIILLENYLKKCYDELNCLVEAQKNLKRQLELTQIITYLESMYLAPYSNSKSFDYNDQKIKFEGLTPRFFYDAELSLVMIKPSAYLFNYEKTIFDSYVDESHPNIGYFETNMGIKNNYGIERMEIFHPHGYQYLREMNGPASMFLVSRSPSEVGGIKKGLRKELSSGLKGKQVTWFDGQLINWNPACLNFVHTSDSPSEACMNYTCLYPEYQVMSRFMYPNPVLQKEEENGRIRI